MLIIELSQIIREVTSMKSWLVNGWKEKKQRVKPPVVQLLTVPYKNVLSENRRKLVDVRRGMRLCTNSLRADRLIRLPTTQTNNMQ